MNDDIRQGQDGTKGWLVIGWFTPDYRPLAESVAFQLNAHGAPYHLYAKEKLAVGWNTRRKPSVVLQAMDDYPDKTLLLMDVDCIVRGDVSPALRIGDVDVGVCAKPRPGRKNRVILTLSSRVAVFRPTPGAREFTQEWTRLCEAQTNPNDEAAMGWAYVSRPGIKYAQLDPRYAGREVGVGGAEDAVICHSSEHDKHKWRPFKWFERRYLRTGRTKARIA